ncbi:MAG: hypothetical protein IJT27_01385 [Clostridia bacterium]|nr:hypothetical protein [Clostridia bacterium]
MMKKTGFLWVLLIAVLLLGACASGKAPEDTTAPPAADTQEIKAWDGEIEPVSVRYARIPAGAAPQKAKTGEKYMIDAVLGALDALAVKEAVTADEGKTTDVIVLIDADGNEVRVDFCGGALLKNGAYYRTEGFDALQSELDRLLESFGGYDYPTAFTATPFQDDRDGLYWIFFHGHGARFTGFDGEWFTGEQLFTWGVDEGVLYVYPMGGDKEEYPVSYGETVDDDNIYLGELTLNEVYPKELDALYVRWVPIGAQIRERLDTGS